MSRPEPERDERCIYDYRAAERADSGTGDCDLCGVQHLFPQGALSITTRLMFARCLASVGRENRIFREDREAAPHQAERDQKTIGRSQVNPCRGRPDPSSRSPEARYEANTCSKSRSIMDRRS